MKEGINTARQVGPCVLDIGTANCFWMLVSDLTTASKVKLLALGTPFDGHADCRRPICDARERVAKKEATNVKMSIVLSP